MGSCGGFTRAWRIDVLVRVGEMDVGAVPVRSWAVVLDGLAGR